MDMRYFTQFLSFSVLSLGLLAPTSFAQLNAAPVAPQAAAPRMPVRAGTPEQQIKDDLMAFVHNLNTSDNFFEVQKYIADSKQGYFGGNEWFKNWINKRNTQQISIDEITVGKIENGTASANVSLKIKHINMQADGKQDIETKRASQKLDLKFGAIRYENGKGELFWQIVSPTTNPIYDKDESSVLSTVTYQLAQQRWTYPNSVAQSSLRRMKELTLCTYQLAQDYNDRIAFAPEHVQEALLPYPKSQHAFQIPNTQDSYTFNGWLSDKTLAQIAEPHKVVMFYEGDSEQPIFRYNDKAAIAFADGHCVLVSREEAKDLIWKP